MTHPHPSHETRKITVVLPAYIIDALRPRLLGDESITECIKRLVRQEALGSHDESDPPEQFIRMDEGTVQRGNGNGGPSTPKPSLKPQPSGGYQIRNGQLWGGYQPRPQSGTPNPPEAP